MILELIERIAQDAGKRGMDFLLIGGQAINHLGYQRFTLDVDFMGHECTRDGWEQLMTGYGYFMSVRTPAFHQYVHGTPGRPQVDVMFVNDRTWRRMRGEASEKLSGRVVVRVPSPRNMVAMKLHSATSPHRSDAAKDWADIEALIRNHGLDLADPDFAELVLRYGGEESLARLKILRQ